MFENIPVEIGIDLATALSIVGASITYVSSERRRRREDSQRDYVRQCERRIDMAYKVVDEVLGILPILRERTAAIHHIVAQNSFDGNGVSDFQATGQAIQTIINDLLDEVELGLMRPLAVKVATVGGDGVWNVARGDFEKSLKIIQQAFSGLERVLTSENINEEMAKVALSQAVPLLYGEKKIGGEIHTLYSALINFSRALKDGLLQSGEDTQQG